jgi:quinol monooxygenase YgiN
MSNKQITIVAFPTAKPGKEEELIERIKAQLKATRQEPGCINIDLHQHCEKSNCFVVYENFTDQAAFDEHLKGPHTKEFMDYLNESGATLNYDHWSILNDLPEDAKTTH